MSVKALLGLTALAAICFLCLRCHAPRIEEEIRAGAEETLAVLNLEGISAKVSGRDVTLRGVVTSGVDRSRAESALSNVEGIRSIDNLIKLDPGPLRRATKVAPSSPGASQEAVAVRPLGFSAQGGRILLRGSVPDDRSRSDLATAASSAWGDGNVVDELTVSPEVDTTGWPSSLDGFLVALKGRDQDLDFSISGGKALLQGTVLSELSRQRLLGALGEALPGLEIEDALGLRVPKGTTEALQVALDSRLQGKIIEYATSSDQLTARGKATLDGLAEVLRRSKGGVELSGHTDSQGDHDRNQDLSQHRAETAAAYLVNLGLEAGRFVAIGYGESRPIASNQTVEGRRKNRRTEFRALEERKP